MNSVPAGSHDHGYSVPKQHASEKRRRIVNGHGVASKQAHAREASGVPNSAGTQGDTDSSATPTGVHVAGDRLYSMD